MDTIDDDWESFLHNDGETDYELPVNNNSNIIENNSKKTLLNDVNEIPKCSSLYISTKTKISYLNKNDIDIKKIFWHLPVINYNTPVNGIIKKQIKYSSSSREEVEYIERKLKDINHYEEQIIEHIDNPDGRIKYKDQRKISIGICKKDILSYRSKKKRAFFNCFVIIMRILHDNVYKEMHIKVFNTGKLEIPGVQNDQLLEKVLETLVATLRPFVGNDLNYLLDKCDTVLINSNFNCGYYIDRDKLYDILKYQYRINSNYDACSYPGIQCKFYYDYEHDEHLERTGQQPKHKNYSEVSFMIFRTGSVLIVGKCDDNILHKIYNFIRSVLETEYVNIKCGSENTEIITNKDRKKKVRKKTILIDAKK
jgi:hypothetical protein